MIHLSQKLAKQSMLHIMSTNQNPKTFLSSSSSLFHRRLFYSLATPKFNSYTLMSKHFFASGRNNRGNKDVNKAEKNKEEQTTNMDTSDEFKLQLYSRAELEDKYPILKEFPDLLAQITSENPLLKENLTSELSFKNFPYFVNKKKMTQQVNQLVKFIDNKYPDLMNMERFIWKQLLQMTNPRFQAISNIQINYASHDDKNLQDVSLEKIILERVSSLILLAYLFHRAANRYHSIDQQIPQFKQQVIFIFHYQKQFNRLFRKSDNPSSLSNTITSQVLQQIQNLQSVETKNNQSNVSPTESFAARYTFKAIFRTSEIYDFQFNSESGSGKFYQRADLQVQKILDQLDSMIQSNLQESRKLQQAQSKLILAKIQNLKRQKKSVETFMRMLREKFFDQPDEIPFKHIQTSFVQIISKNPWNYKHRRQISNVLALLGFAILILGLAQFEFIRNLCKKAKERLFKLLNIQSKKTELLQNNSEPPVKIDPKIEIKPLETQQEYQQFQEYPSSTYSSSKLVEDPINSTENKKYDL